MICARILWIVALLASSLAWAQEKGPSQEPGIGPPEQIGAADAVTPFAAATALKLTRPEVFGDAQGVLVTEVLPGSQGDAIGLKPGDILHRFGGTVDRADSERSGRQDRAADVSAW